MTWELIRKRRKAGEPAPNLKDYEAACKTFSWDEARGWLEGLPGGGLNTPTRRWTGMSPPAMEGSRHPMARAGRQRRDSPTESWLRDRRVRQRCSRPRARPGDRSSRARAGAGTVRRGARTLKAGMTLAAVLRLRADP